MGTFDHLFNDSFDESVEGIDYIINAKGLRENTEFYLAKRGYCCSNGCKNCPYSPRAVKGNRQLRRDVSLKYKLNKGH
ncbi:MAG: DUF5522 domain-containing protein [Mangrovibacterium sp.]